MADRTVKVTLDLVTAAYVAGARTAEQATATFGREVEKNDKRVERMSRSVEGLRSALATLPARTAVQVDVDVRGLQQARNELRRLGQDRVKVTVGLDTAGWEREARRAARAVRVSVRASIDVPDRVRSVDVRARLDTSRWQQEAQAAARRLRVNVNSRLQVRVEGRLRERDLQRQLNRMRLHVRITPTLGNPGSGGSLGASLGTSAGRGFAGAFAKVGLFSAFLPQAVAGVNAITAATVGLAGSLTSVLGIAGALPAAFGSAATVVGSIGLSLLGVIDAVGKLNEEQDQAGAVSQRNAASAQQAAERQRNASNAVTSARRGVAAASRGVEDAERSLTRAQEASGRSAQAVGRARQEAERALVQAQDASRRSQLAVTRAQEDAIRVQQDLTDARKTAAERLQDLSLRQTSNALAEERATLSLRQAQDALNTARQSGVGVVDAELGVREQVQALAELRVQRARDSDEAAEAARQGVEGSDVVAAAQDRVADAAENVRDAQSAAADAAREVADVQRDGIEQVAQAQLAARDAADQVADAQRGVVDAQQGVAVAQEAVTEAIRDQTAALTAVGPATASSVRNAQNALAALSPAQRDFALYLFSLKGDLAELQASAAQGLLPGLTEDIERTRVLLPTLDLALLRTGRTLTNLDNGKQRFTNAEGIDRINTLLLSADGLTGSLSRSGILLADAFLRVGVDAAPMVARLGQAAERSSELVLAYVEAKSASGDLGRSFERIYDRAQLFTSILGNTRGALVGTFDAGSTASDGMLVNLDDLTARWERWVDSVQGQTALRDWFDEGRESMSELAGLVGDLRTEFGGLTDEADFSDFVRDVRQVVPDVAALVKSMTGSGETGRQLLQALTAIGEALDEVNAGGAIATFVETLSTMLVGIAEIVQAVPGGSQALGVLATTFGALLAAKLVIGPIIGLAGALQGLVAGAAGLSATTALLGGVGAALAAGAFLYGAYATASADFQRNVTDNAEAIRTGTLVEAEAAAESIRTFTAESTEFLDRWERRNAARKFVTPWDSLRAVSLKGDLAEQGAAAERYADDVEQTFGRVGRYLADQATRQGDFTNEIRFDYGLQSEAARDYADTAEKAGVKVGDSYDQIRTKLDAYAYAQSDAGKANQRHVDDLAILSDASATAADKTDALRREMERLDGGVTDAQEGLIRFREGLDGIAAAAEQSGRSLDISTEAGRNNQSAIIDAKRALDERITSLQNSGAAEAEVREAVASGSAELRDRITDTYGVNEESKALIETYRLTPTDITTQIRLLGADEALTKFGQLSEAAKNIFRLSGVTPEVAASLDRQDQAQAARGVIKRGYGGAVYGTGTAHSDDIDAKLSHNEHVVTAEEVAALGGHNAVERLRAAALAGMVPTFAQGGPVLRGTLPITYNPDRLSARLAAVVDRLATTVSNAEQSRQPSSSRGLIPIMRDARQYVMDTYGIRNIGGFSDRFIKGTRTKSDHAKGKAIDVMTTNRALGDRVAADFAFGPAHRRFSAENVIWQQAISNRGRPFRGMADRGSPTQNHRDHVHVDTYAQGGRVVRANSRPRLYGGRAVSTPAAARPRLGPPGGLTGLPTSGDQTVLAAIRNLDRLLASETRYSERWLDLYAQRSRALEEYVGGLVRAAEVAQTAASSELDSLNRLLDAEGSVRERQVRAQDAYLDARLSRERTHAQEEQRLVEESAQARLVREQAYLTDRQRLIEQRAQDLDSGDPYAGFGEKTFGSDLGFLTRNLGRQAKETEDYFRELALARSRGLSEGSIAALGLDQGPQALGQLRRVNAADLAQVDEFNAAVAQRTGRAQAQAQAEAVSGTGALGRQLVDLRRTYTDDLDRIGSDFLTRQAELRRTYTDDLGRLTSDFVAEQQALGEELALIGVDQGRGFGEAVAQGLESSLPAIRAQAAAVAAALAGAQASEEAASGAQASAGGQLEQQVRDLFASTGNQLATAAETEPERLARIVAELTSGRSLGSLANSLRDTDAGIATQVRQAFAAAGQQIATGSESEAQRVARIVAEVRSGSRSIEAVRASVAALPAPAGTRSIGSLGPDGGRARVQPVVQQIMVKIGETELRQISREEFTAKAVGNQVASRLAGVMR